jgi:sulfur carrier protein
MARDPHGKIRPLSAHPFSPSDMPGFVLNGEPRPLDRPRNVMSLIEELGLSGKKLAVERNGAIVPRSEFGRCDIADGDRLEIVVAVGGG